MQRTILSMAIPTLDKWKIIPNGSVIGTVRNHASIADGDVITTSQIQNPELASRQSIVTTMTGSKYKLLEPRGEISAEQQRKEDVALAAILAKAEKDFAANNGQIASEKKQPPAPKKGFFGGWVGPFQKSAENDSGSGSMTSEARKKEMLSRGPEWQEAVRKYNLNGDTIGLEGEYLLAKKPTSSTSGKSSICEAYKTEGATGLPRENATPVCMKISDNFVAISREYENYRKLSFFGMAAGEFVKCYQFFPVAGYDLPYQNQCALVIEKGDQDLKTFLNSKGKLEGKLLRDACESATKCAQALHKAGMVWTDMKTENFVVMSNGDVKGIDLESSMPINDYPVDYSPEACPPEFAKALLEGDGLYFPLDGSYDVWSLGMLMLELSTGRGYFDNKTPAQITKLLRDMDDETMSNHLEGIECDDRLKDLIGRCLQKNPKKRPNTAQMLMHPYFLAGNPFGFLAFN